MSYPPRPHKVWLLGNTYAFHVTGKDTAEKYAAVELSTPSGGEAPLHRHTRESEGFYVIRGEFMVQYGDKKLKAEAGTFLHLEKHIPHSWKNVGSDTGSVLTTIVPAGLENFFIDGGISIPDEIEAGSFSPP